MSAEGRPDVELHYRDCACRGTGWLGYPNIGPRAHYCVTERVLRLSFAAWEQAGRPRTADYLQGGEHG